MPNILQHWHRVRGLPPRLIAKKVWHKLRNWMSKRGERDRDSSRSSFLLKFSSTTPFTLRFGSDSALILSERLDATLALLSNYYLDHRFDLLGSGWVKLSRGMSCRGLEGFRYESSCASRPEDDYLDTVNYFEIKRIRDQISESYQPIDWHLDFKSGYRWDPKSWYREVPYGHMMGVDVKVPWELARMQHLPQLALASFCASRKQHAPELHDSHIYAKEFRNQVLDFIAGNPPRYGVNWVCTMDVAIRVTNWLVAYDLFMASGARFDAMFDFIFCRSILEHGHHIVNNLEWSDNFRGNHYLADIAGLLFTAAYLPRTAETDVWLAFSIQELIAEVESQFNDDGANFEASTSYHRLSAEIVIYSTALVLGLNEDKRKALAEYDFTLHKVTPALSSAPMTMYAVGDVTSPFPEWYFERIERMAEFTLHLTKPDGQIPQIGDNDSGYFLKLFPPMLWLTVSEARSQYSNLANYNDLSADAPYLLENHLNHRQLVGAINALFNRSDFSTFSGDSVASEFVSDLAGKMRIKSYLGAANATAAELVRIGNDGFFMSFSPFAKSKSLRFIEVTGESIRGGLSLFGYPDFGLYIFKSKRLYLALRCGPVGQNGTGGHAHNDQLVIELAIDGENWITDPGSYLYTPIPTIRNTYRSASAHFVPRYEGQEPARLDLNLFRIEEATQAKCLYFGDEGFIGMHKGYGLPVWRVVGIESNSIQIHDYYSNSSDPPLEGLLGRDSMRPHPAFSPGYGIISARSD